ncbi:MAG: hypothetical protein JSV25_14180 [Spirochaetota bacterium]|nr:MAG: hypothetical protein JSV25_14180 [Spirochaetota bacterium]
MKKIALLIFALLIVILPVTSNADKFFTEPDQTLSYIEELTLHARRNQDRGSGGEQTLISGEIESGGTGGPILKFTGVSDTFCVFLGGRGGWIINHMFMLGGGGYGLVSDVFISGNKLHMGYGGFYAEYIINSDALVHFTIGSLIGLGNAHFDPEGSDSHSYFVLEPEANVELNVVTFFRVCAGVSYRFTIGASGPAGLNDAALSGLSANLFFKFGHF